jgi:hypothetical protein
MTIPDLAPLVRDDRSIATSSRVIAGLVPVIPIA